MPPASYEAVIKTAVVTGGHAFDVPGLHALFRSASGALPHLPGVEAYIQHMDDFASSPQEVRDGYDVVLFYIMLMEGPTDDGLPWYQGKPKAALEHLGETEQGIFVLHHAILAYPKWDVWRDIVGIADRSFGFHYGQRLRIQVADPGHPITQGLADWEMVDETYTMQDAGEGSQVLLTADHPLSMRTIAWTRQHKNARVFCFQSGHDDQAFAHPSFRAVIGRGIHWLARR